MLQLRFLVSLAVALALPHLAWSADTDRTRAPVVFAHGLGVSAVLYEKFIPLKRVFRKLGYTVHVARTPVGGSLEDRAKVLAAEVERLVPEGPYHLMGHSMGGLDARLAIHRAGLGSRCLSLTTLSTPHRGSPLAELALKAWNAGNLDEVPGLKDVVGLLGGDLLAIGNLTPGHLETVFNPEVRDDPRVAYFSMGFYVPSPSIAYVSAAPLWLMHDLMVRLGRPLNDGPVPLESAAWGTYLGSFPGDHYAETAPVLFGGRRIDRDVFGRALANLDERF